MRYLILAVALMGGVAKAEGPFAKPYLSADSPLTGMEEAALLTIIGSALTSVERADAIPCFTFGHKGGDRSRYGGGRTERRTRTADGAELSNTCVAFATPSVSEKPVGGAADGKSQLPVPTVDQYVRAGLSLADHYCSVYFRSTSHDARYRNFSRNIFNDVGTLVTALFGFGTGDGQLTGGLAALTGFADKTSRNYDDSFLVSADLPALRSLVDAERLQRRSDIAALMALPQSERPADFADATRIIRGYGEICSFLGMKELINRELTNAATRASNNSNAKAELARAELAKAEKEKAEAAVNALISEARRAQANAQQAARRATRQAEAAKAEAAALRRAAAATPAAAGPSLPSAPNLPGEPLPENGPLQPTTGEAPSAL